MNKRPFKQQFFILLSCFIVSRVIIRFVGVRFEYNALYEYWQYLDITSLKTNLLQSLWYLHAQPPIFNFILGIILKTFGHYSGYVLEFLLLAITFCNGILLLSIMRKIMIHNKLSLLLALAYILSPASILFENELFYTTFTSLLLLLSVYYMIRFSRNQSWPNSIGLFTALCLLCLTRSVYHLSWLILVSGLLIVSRYGKHGFKKMLIPGLLCICIVSGWYVKNYLVFGNFSASSWMGMNFSRIVFQNHSVKDSNGLTSIPPFMPISFYKNYISGDYKQKFAGINDRVLLMEMKNERYINMNHAGYIEVSKKYMTASLDEVKQHPLSYFKNAFTAFIIFFTPASSYFKVTANDNRIAYYDLVYSFNPSHLFKEEIKKKQTLAIAAIPKFLMYCFVFFFVIKAGRKAGHFPFFNIFIMVTIVFSLTASSLLDYGENMRFRYEIEPLFLILAAHAIMLLKYSRKITKV